MMKTRNTYFIIIIILLLFQLFHLSVLCQDTDKLPRFLGMSNQGTDFWFTVPPTLEDEINAGNYVGIYVTSSVKTQVNIEIPDKFIKDNKYTIPDGVIEFKVKTSDAQPYKKSGHDAEVPDLIYPKFGIHVYSKEPIIVYVVIKVKSNSEGFLAIPVSSLGTEYIVSSFPDMSEMYSNLNFPSMTAIVAPFDDTEVTYTLGGNQQTKTAGNMKPGESVTKTLNKGDVWMISSKGDRSDLSGSKIISSQPISVISGNQCANIPQRNGWCNYIAEMEMPTFSWGQSYHAGSVPGRRYSSIVRIYAKDSNTTVYRNGEKIGFLKSSGGIQDIAFLETRITPEKSEQKSAVFTADKPIGITLYNAGTQEDGDMFLNSDPFQMSLSPIENYANDLTFNTPASTGAKGFNTNYVNINLPIDEDGKISKDVEYAFFESGKWWWFPLRNKFGNTPTEIYSYDINGTKYGLKTITLPNDGTYRIRSTKPIAAYIFGFSENESYGFPAGVLLRNLEIPDSISPDVVWNSGCNGIFNGTVTDVPSEAGNRSNLSLMFMNSDSSFNSEFSFTDFIPGNSHRTDWKLTAIDKTKEARSQLIFADRRGNTKTVTVEYFPTILQGSPYDNNYGQYKTGRETLLHLNLVNKSKKAVTISCLGLASGSRGFNIGNIQLPFEMLPGETKGIPVKFYSDVDGILIDTLRAGDSCGCIDAALLSMQAGTPVIIASQDYDFGKVSEQTTKEAILSINNTGSIDLEIYNIKKPSIPVFTVDLPSPTVSNPLIIKAQSSLSYKVTFTPLSNKDTYIDSIEFFSNADTFDSITVISGTGTITGVDDNIEYGNLIIYPNPAYDISIIQLPKDCEEIVSVKVKDIFGNIMKEINCENHDDFLRLDLSEIGGGIYFIEISFKDKILVNKLTVVR